MTTKKTAGGVQAYLTEIGRKPLLTPEQEIHLARQVQRMVKLKELDRELTAQEQAEVRRGERAVRRFVESNLRLVVTVAKKYTRSAKSLDLMDLIQEGNTGLVTGVLKFDPERGYKFSTYAYWWIRQGMSRALRYKDRTIRLPGNIGEMAYGWGAKIQRLRERLGRNPSHAEIAAECDITVQDLMLFYERGGRVTSLDAVISGTENMCIGDSVADESRLDGYEALEQAVLGEVSQSLKDALQTLEDRERRWLAQRWGLYDGVERTYVEIGREEGVSRERVRQVCSVAQRKLRVQLANGGATQAALTA